MWSVHNRLTSAIAYKASDYLLTLKQRGAIESEENGELDRIYAEYGPSHAVPSSDAVSPISRKADQSAATPEPKASAQDTPPAPSSEADGPQAQLLLSRDAVPSILKLFSLPESAAGEMYRAIEQARQRTSASTSTRT
jgi:hypothetical protein